MKRLLVTVAILAVLGIAGAQGFRLSGGLDLQPLAHKIGVTATVERPSFTITALGVRWGPVATLNLKTTFATIDAQLLTGFKGVIVLPNSSWAAEFRLLLNTEAQTGQPFIIGPDLQIAFTTQF